MFYYGYLYHKLIYFSEQDTHKPPADKITDNQETYEEFDKLANEFLDETEA